MISFLLWNVQKKNLLTTIARLARLYDVDILILIESRDDPEAVVRALNATPGPKLYEYPRSQCDHVRIYTSFSADFAKSIDEDNRFTVRHVKLPGADDFLLVAAHLVSKTDASGASQAMQAVEFAAKIIQAENHVGHFRTIVAGDLNMNPFEEGMVGANGMHGVMSSDLARKKDRTVQKKRYRYFYNPMWSLLGDASPGPAGTHYYRKAEMVNYFWNMYDQVLLRPDLLSSFRNGDLEIVCSDGQNSFLKRSGLPDDKRFSDHLPIAFKLRL